MPSKVEVTVTKSPIAPICIPDYDSAAFSDRVVYYVRLSNGLVATRPEDFPNKSEKKRDS